MELPPNVALSTPDPLVAAVDQGLANSTPDILKAAIRYRQALIDQYLQEINQLRGLLPRREGEST